MGSSNPAGEGQSRGTRGAIIQEARRTINTGATISGSMAQPTMAYTLRDFDYELPPELIAQHPLPQRSASRLLRLSGDTLADLTFTDLPALLQPGDVLVFNDTRVIKARLFGSKPTGGRIELLVERLLDDREFLAHIRASHGPRSGTRIRLADAVDATVIGRDHDLFRVRLESECDLSEFLEQHGRVPLPPYITHTANDSDLARYQTVYARVPGAVAAPTAGLHFDEAMMDRLRASGIVFAHVTLHVGAGTFRPVRVEDIAAHRMHSEWYEIPTTTVSAIDAARERGARVVAVGTTSLRALESAARTGALAPGAGETELFITPGFGFRVVDRLITNFHLPRSTLLMLVSAFAGMASIRRAYAHAIGGRYRFFSYGDAMLIDRADAPADPA